MNVPRPIVAGGTGATTPAQALINLGAMSSTGSTMTGTLTISDSNPAIVLNHSTNPGSNAVLGYGPGNKERWSVELGNSTPETGSNSGSDFAIAAYQDSGAIIGAALTITRASLASTFSGNVTINAASGMFPDHVNIGKLTTPGNAFLDFYSNGATSNARIIQSSGGTLQYTAPAHYLTGGGVAIQTGGLAVQAGGVALSGAGDVSIANGNVVLANGGIAIQTPGKGIAGDATGTAANTGVVGELLKAQNPGLVTVASGALVDLVALTVTAGDWQVWGYISVDTPGTPASGDFRVYLKSTANFANNFKGDAFGALYASTPLVPVRISSPVTHFVSLYNNSGTSASVAANTATIYARRVR